MSRGSFRQLSGHLGASWGILGRLGGVLSLILAAQRKYTESMLSLMPFSNRFLFDCASHNRFPIFKKS